MGIDILLKPGTAIYLYFVLNRTIKADSPRESASMVALTVYQILLYPCSGQTDIIVGSAIANRRRSELDNLVVFFVNILPLRGELN